MQIPTVKKELRFIGVVLTLFAFVSASVGVYMIYKNFVWKPFIEIVGVDFESGNAEFLVDGKRKVLEGDSTIAIGGDWGIRFGKDGETQKFDKLELVKNGLVHKTVYANS